MLTRAMFWRLVLVFVLLEGYGYYRLFRWLIWG